METQTGQRIPIHRELMPIIERALPIESIDSRVFLLTNEPGTKRDLQLRARLRDRPPDLRPQGLWDQF